MSEARRAIKEKPHQQNALTTIGKLCENMIDRKWFGTHNIKPGRENLSILQGINEGFLHNDSLNISEKKASIFLVFYVRVAHS